MPLALVIEDNVDLLELYAFALQLSGWTVDTATNVDDAVRALGMRKPDVVITDLAMPGADGSTLIARVRELFANERLPIVIVTGQPHRLRLGGGEPPLAACHVLEKPVMPDRLSDVAAAAVRGCGKDCPGAAVVNPGWEVRGCGRC